MGDRLSTLIPQAAQQVIAASVLLSPFLPLLFMGEEYGEQAPFQYFIDHGDEQLIESVRKGRMAEFKRFGWEKVPDPYDVKTFEASRLTPKNEWGECHHQMASWVKELIRLRKQHPSLGPGIKGHQLKVWTHKNHNVLSVYRKHPNAPAMLLILGFNNNPVELILRQPKGQWSLLLDSYATDYSSDRSENLSSLLCLPLIYSRPAKNFRCSPILFWVYQQSEI